MVSFHIKPPENFAQGKSKKSRRDRLRRQKMFRQQDGKCFWCRSPMEMNQLRLTPMGRLKENPAFATFEHLVPKSHGGVSGYENRVLAHAACNNNRHKRRWPHDPVYGGPTLQAIFEGKSHAETISLAGSSEAGY